MTTPDTQQIKIGSGGSILQDADNQQLLDQIQAAPALSAVDLLKLATLYKGGPTNDALANHLALFAIGLLVRDGRDPQLDAAGTPELAREAAPAAKNEAWDRVEDFLFGAIDSEDKGQVGPRVLWPRPPLPPPQIQWVSYSGVGLLIETHPPDNSHYIIGVGPAPASLPNE